MTSWTNLNKYIDQVLDCELLRLLSLSLTLFFFSQLEVKLAKVEEQCLEKDLILEQVNRLTERITNKVDSSKDDTLSLAKKVNQIQSQIKDTTKKMMATVSELSIAQAAALKMQEEVKTKELLFEQCSSRMEKVYKLII